MDVDNTQYAGTALYFGSAPPHLFDANIQK